MDGAGIAASDGVAAIHGVALPSEPPQYSRPPLGQPSGRSPISLKSKQTQSQLRRRSRGRASKTRARFGRRHRDTRGSQLPLWRPRAPPERRLDNITPDTSLEPCRACRAVADAAHRAPSRALRCRVRPSRYGTGPCRHELTRVGPTGGSQHMRAAPGPKAPSQKVRVPVAAVRCPLPRP